MISSPSSCLLLQIFPQDHPVAVAGTADITRTAASMAGEMGWVVKSRSAVTVAPAIGEIFQYRRHRSASASTGRQIRAASFVRRRPDGDIVEHLNLAGKLLDDTHIHLHPLFTIRRSRAMSTGFRVL